MSHKGHKHKPGQYCDQCVGAGNIVQNSFNLTDRNDDIPAFNCIQAYLHCKKCLEERPTNISAADFARFEVGVTPLGIQIFCQRHELNVIHIDFDGFKPRMNARSK